MPIEVYANDVASHHWLAFKTDEEFNNENLHFFSVTGVALFGMKGTSGNWLRDDLIINVRVPTDKLPVPPPPGPGNFVPQFRAKHWTVYAGLNSVFNKNHAVNSGHAVDTFELLNPGNKIAGSVQMKCRVAVSDSDAFLYRVGFKVELLLYFVGYDEIIID